MALPYNELTKKMEIVKEITSYEPECYSGLSRSVLLDWTLENLEKKVRFLNEAYGVGCKKSKSEEEACLECFELLIPEKTIVI